MFVAVKCCICCIGFFSVFLVLSFMFAAFIVFLYVCMSVWLLRHNQ